MRNVVPRKGTETEDKEDYHVNTETLRNVVPRKGTETGFTNTHNINHVLLRNVVPRKGTETYNLFSLCYLLFIEKCSSP